LTSKKAKESPSPSLGINEITKRVPNKNPTGPHTRKNEKRTPPRRGGAFAAYHRGKVSSKKKGRGIKPHTKHRPTPSVRLNKPSRSKTIPPLQVKKKGQWKGTKKLGGSEGAKEKKCVSPAQHRILYFSCRDSSHPNQLGRPNLVGREGKSWPM